MSKKFIVSVSPAVFAGEFLIPNALNRFVLNKKYVISNIYREINKEK